MLLARIESRFPALWIPYGSRLRSLHSLPSVILLWGAPVLESRDQGQVEAMRDPDCPAVALQQCLLLPLTRITCHCGPSCGLESTRTGPARRQFTKGPIPVQQKAVTGASHARMS